MASSSRMLFETFRKKGVGEREAFFQVIDHFNEQHWHDRNRYGEEIKALKQRVNELEQHINNGKDSK